MPKDFIGSMVTQNPTGFTPGVTLIDDFEGGFHWEITGTGADFVGEKSTDQAYNASNSMKLSTRATNPANEDNVRAVKDISLGVSRFIRMRWRWIPAIANVVGKVFMELATNTPAGVFHFGVRLTPALQTIELLNDSGDWEVITGKTGALKAKAWGNVDISFDMVTGEFLALEVEGIVVDVAGQLGEIDTATDVKWGEVTFGVFADDGSEPIFYIDNLLITEFENV